MSTQAAATETTETTTETTTESTGGETETTTTTTEGGDAEGGSVLGGPEGSGEQGQTSGETDGPVAGAELEVTLPEGTEVNEAMLSGFTEVAKEVGLDSEKASKLATWYAKQAEVVSKASVEAWDKKSLEWEKSLEADPDIGGQNFKASKAAAQQAVLRFGGKELAAELDRYGIGNLPALVKAFVRIGNEFKEDTTSGPTSTAGAVPTAKQRLDLLYPTSASGDGK